MAGTADTDFTSLSHALIVAAELNQAWDDNYPASLEAWQVHGRKMFRKRRTAERLAARMPADIAARFLVACQPLTAEDAKPQHADVKPSSVTPSPEYRHMVYFACATLHFYRDSIKPEWALTMATNTDKHVESFVAVHAELMARITQEARNLFQYELSHLQICRAVAAYFLAGQTVGKSRSFELPA